MMCSTDRKQVAIKFEDHTVYAGQSSDRVFGPFSGNIKQGEVISLTGPSGCGKSSLLYQIVDTLGKTKQSPSTLGVQVGNWDYLGQRDFLFPWYSGERNLISLSNKEIASSNYAARVSETLEIQDLLSKPYSTLSGGERQRVGLWTLLSQKPTHVLIDEPFTALDFRMKMKCLCLLGEYLADEKITSLIVSHDLDVLTYSATDIWFMDTGENDIKIIPNVPTEIFDLSTYKTNRITQSLENLFDVLSGDLL